MNERNLERPGTVVNPLFARALGNEAALLLAFPFRAGMRPAKSRHEEPRRNATPPDPRRN